MIVAAAIPFGVRRAAHVSVPPASLAFILRDTDDDAIVRVRPGPPDAP